MYVDHDSVRFLLRFPVVAFFGAFLADCLDGVLAILMIYCGFCVSETETRDVEALR